MKIHLAIISTGAGIDVVYAGNSAEKAEAAVATWCRGYWHDEDVDLDTGIDDPTTIDDHEVCQLYFNSESVISLGEQCEITEVEYQDDK
jgi:hypothetical protein